MTNFTTDITTLTLAQLADVHNQLAEKSVKKFATKPKAVARVEAILESTGHQVEITDGGFEITAVEPDYTVEGAKVDETEDTDAPTPVLTDLQYALMDAVAHAEHNPGNGATPEKASDVNTWFWADELAAELGVSEKAIGGCVTSLQEAGLIGVEIVSAADHKKHGDDSGIWFTDAGFAAWAQARSDGRLLDAYKKIAAKNAGSAKKRGPAPMYADDAKITVLVASNPCRTGTKHYAHFELYSQASTVAEYIALGGTRGDVIWDVAHGFVKIGG